MVERIGPGLQEIPNLMQVTLCSHLLVKAGESPLGLCQSSEAVIQYFPICPDGEDVSMHRPGQFDPFI